jgi:hypothetical protein
MLVPKLCLEIHSETLRSRFAAFCYRHSQMEFGNEKKARGFPLGGMVGYSEAATHPTLAIL